MFDAQCDLAALVYERHEDPDEILFAFASRLAAHGCRAVGLVQRGHHHWDAGLSALLLHSGEELQLLQDVGACPSGSRLDTGRLRAAGRQMEHAIDQGADVMIVNRFGRQELAGKGLWPLIERAAHADIPAIIAVPSHRFAEWIKFVDGMTVKLRCQRAALDDWWQGAAIRNPRRLGRQGDTMCGLLK
jgi:Protein of unknown function (DUF2478)